MGIKEYLHEVALNKIWENPHADRNAIFLTSKISRPYGTIGELDLGFNTIDMPTINRRYMVFSLGKEYLSDIGIDDYPLVWKSLHEITANSQVAITLFSNGRLAILDGAYLKVTETGDLVIALDYQLNITLLHMEANVYIRFYSNVYYSKTAPLVNKRLVSGTLVYDANDNSSYIRISVFLRNLTTQVNALTLYLNGLYLPNGLPSENILKTGDVLEYLLDPSIMEINSLVVADLESYLSADNTTKNIISLDTLDGGVYVDDIDFYCIGTMDNGLTAGVFFPRLSPRVISQLTYKDWALNANMLLARFNELRDFVDTPNNNVTNLKIYILRRNNNLIKPRILDSSRIMDLMNLPTDIRVQAITGVNSTFPMWQAKNLEICPFNKWINLELPEIETSDFNGVLNRDEAIGLLENVRLLDGNTDWSLPALASNGGGTLLTYSSIDGGIIPVGYSPLDHVNETYPNGLGCEIFLPGLNATLPLDKIVDAGNAHPVNIESGFGVFIYYHNNGEFIKARYNIDYTLTDNLDVTTINWSTAICQYTRYIRTSQKRVFYTISVTLDDITAGIDLYRDREVEFDIGMGNLFVWFNNCYLTYGLDYGIIDGKLWLMVNQPVMPDVHSLTVLYVGLPNQTFKFVDTGIRGWIRHGKITDDNVYELYEHRNKLFFLGGRAIPFSAIHEAEGYVDKLRTITGVSYADGLPYVIVDKPQFTRDEDLDKFLPTKISEAILDKALSTFISALYPQQPTPGIITIPSKYDIVSPFMNSIISAVVNGEIIANHNTYSLQDVYDLTEQYLHLLKIDPCITLNDLDFTYVNVHPKWTTELTVFNLNQYTFILKVNEMLLNSRIVLINVYITVE